MLNKIGKILLLVSLGVLAAGIVFDLLSILFFLFLFFISVSLCFLYFESALPKRKKVTLIVFIIALLLFFTGWYFKKMHWFGANIILTFSIFLFSFTVLPLFTKSRYQTRNISISTTVLLLSITDLSALILISLGILSRILHWPVGQALPIGIILLVTSMVCWNFSFRKEVKRRMEAEEKLQNTLAELEEKQQEIISSIRYAQRIQQAHLPNEHVISKHMLRLKDNNFLS